MTVINGNIKDIGLDPLSGVLVATSVRFRTSGDVVIAPESRSFPIAGGVVSVDLVPGPTRLTVQVGSHARDEFDVVVPGSGPVTLATLIDEAFEWTPEQVSRFAQLRDEAVAAAGRAEAAAGNVDDAIAGAADVVVQAVEADRVAAQQAATAAAGSASAASGSASAAAGSEAAAAGSASSAANDRDQTGLDRAAAHDSAVDADVSRAAAVTAQGAAEGAAAAAAGSASAADGARAGAEAAEGRARDHAESFGVTAEGVTGAPGSETTVQVSGDGPAYHLTVTTPRGDKGDKGDDGEVSQAALDAAVATLVDNAPEALNTLSELADALGGDPNFATTVSTEIGKRALIDGAPAAYNTLGKLVTALQNHELGGSTDASLLTGALTDQVDASEAMVESALDFPGGPGVTTNTVAGWVETIYYMGNLALEGLEDKSDVGHKHPVTDFTMTGTASSTTFARGDGTWATPANTTYSVPTQAEAEAGTATTARAFTAQRVAQAAIAASGKKDWQGTQAQYDALGTKDADRTYWIV